MTATIRAFHNDPALRANAIARMRAHADADEIVGGVYLSIDPGAPGGYRACHIGCLVAELDETTREAIAAGREAEPDDGWHAAAERLLGLPQRYSRLFEGIFEPLPAAERSSFAVALTEAIPAGADLERVVDEMMIATMSDPEHGCRQYAEPTGRAAIDTAVGLYQRRLAGDEPSHQEWDAAAAAAWVAAARATAAWAADWAAAADAARAAARAAAADPAAAWAAARAADWAATAAARAGVKENIRRRQADTLIELTRNAR